MKRGCKKIDWQKKAERLGFKTEKAMWDKLYIEKNESPDNISLTFEIEGNKIHSLTIYSRLRKLGYRIDKQARYKKIHNDLAVSKGYPNRREMLIDMYHEQDMSARKIARIIKYDAVTVLNWLRAEGVHIKPRGGPNNVEYYRQLKREVMA